MTEMAKTYDPKQVEPRWYRHWREQGLFEAGAGQGDPACIVIPPPNVTGILHMGHALNNTIQDVLIRWWRMQGRAALWVPGTDHAGIATQNVVERKLHKEGKTREDLGRERFLEEVWKWKDQYGGTIVNQLKQLGASCDWSRERFTMDEGLSRAVTEVFCRLFEKNLIYRGHYIINWCPRCRTALSDEESEHRPVNGKLYHLRYPIKGSKKRLRVATTRPETMLGDVALAVNPRDERYEGLVGQTVLLPVLNRELRIIADDFVDPEFGTGVVKVTPAHDPNDFEMGVRHELEPIDVMEDDGTMAETAGPYAGMDRFACREQLLKDLEEQNLLEKVEEHDHSIGHCYRCDTMVEPRLSPQWFVRMKPLARPAIEAVKDGRIKFTPERWTRVYLDWMTNIRDWCISRQIWWGHRIPVFYCDDCDHVWADRGTPEVCPKCASGAIRQDPDVLDTWFSSWLWPFSVFGWPEESRDLEQFYPTDTLVTASEIIFFWVARMIMSGLEFMDDIPFRRVYIHGTVRDDDGVKMSKSLGNSIDPLDIIDRYSADALRFSLIMLTATGQDVYLSDEKFEIGRNFGTKIWNAARFMKMNDDGAAFDPRRPPFDEMALEPDDQHIIARLNETIASVSENLERFRFNDAALSLYDFLWHNFCDWYVEYSKSVFYGEDEQRKQDVIRVMHYVLCASLRLLHPIMPFLTEELWHAMGYTAMSSSIMTAEWPESFGYEEMKPWGVRRATVEYVEAKHDLIRVGRTLRADYDLKPKQRPAFRVRPSQERFADMLHEDRGSVADLLPAAEVVVDREFHPESAMPSGISRLGTVYMSIEGLVDVEAEIQKLHKQLETVEQGLTAVNRKLENENFLNKAPREVVDTQKQRKSELQEKSRKLKRLIGTLRNA
ncbi:valine--tRNA ligase [Kiritimatiella glycovorans]|uniref:Valine--tRNA ligase n=1 Tax=Kiritimatiella glycovorans TaxID=1307763 RepID=A0A0G3EF47_9BACT|nr:valine--tRNA ligase [Kiritimatiella glycovorans]AKJ65081.1 Valine--tRNA ligase [Kiritimatiella glycovorans]